MATRTKKRRPKRRWFSAGAPLGWQKSDSQEVRLRTAMRNRGGNSLAAARALQALANVAQDTETKRKAGADAKKLFARHRKGK